jgi:hypothetical protein
MTEPGKNLTIFPDRTPAGLANGDLLSQALAHDRRPRFFVDAAAIRAAGHAQMDQVTQQNAALVEEASAAAQSMSAQSGTLREVVSIFKLAVDPLKSAPSDASS